MLHEYMSDTKEGSTWHISHLCEISSLSFQAREAGKFIKSPGGSENCLGKNGYLLVYSYSGLGELLYGGKSYKLSKRALSLIDCKNSYSLKPAPDSDEDWVYYWIRFDGNNCVFIYDTVYSGGFSVINAGQKEIRNDFESVIKEIQGLGIESCFRVSHNISSLLTHLVELKLLQAHRRERRQKTIGIAAGYIRENYNRQLDIDNLADKASLSKYYFIKLFKEFMYMAPYEYVILYRINEAKKYLRATSLKVSQISDRVGFNDECNFIRTFKRVTGSTPLHYRDSERDNSK